MVVDGGTELSTQLTTCQMHLLSRGCLHLHNPICQAFGIIHFKPKIVAVRIVLPHPPEISEQALPGSGLQLGLRSTLRT